MSSLTLALRAVTAVLTTLAVFAALHGQAYATRIGAPDAVERTVWALVPHVLLIVSLAWFSKTTTEAVVLAVISGFVWLTSDFNGHDELFGPYRDLVIVCGELFIGHADIADLPAVAGVGLFVTSAAAGLLGAMIERLVR